MASTNWDKLKNGLDKYISIMQDFESTDVSAELKFQTKFKGFYRIRRNQEFCNQYFSILQEHKKNKMLSFENVLTALLTTGKLEASFSSKLLATINPELPVWDKEVLRNIDSELMPSSSTGDRIKDAVQKYNAMVDYYKVKIQSEEGKQMIQMFDKNYPGSNITDLKKIDLILWQTRIPVTLTKKSKNEINVAAPNI